MKDLNVLLENIETLRTMMHGLIQKESDLYTLEIITISQKLDELIVEFCNQVVKSDK